MEGQQGRTDCEECHFFLSHASSTRARRGAYRNLRPSVPWAERTREGRMECRMNRRMRGKRVLGARKRQEHADEVSARTQQRETRECWSLPPAEHLTTCKAVLHWSRIAKCCVPAALSRPCQLLALTRAAGEGALNALNDVLPQKQRGGRRAGMDAWFQNQRSLIGCAEAPHGRQPRPGTAAAGCHTKAV